MNYIISTKKSYLDCESIGQWGDAVALIALANARPPTTTTTAHIKDSSIINLFKGGAMETLDEFLYWSFLTNIAVAFAFIFVIYLF